MICQLYHPSISSSWLMVDCETDMNLPSHLSSHLSSHDRSSQENKEKHLVGYKKSILRKEVEEW